MTKKPLSGIAPIKKAAKAPPYKPSPHGEGGPRQRWIGCFRMQHKCASLSPILPSVFHTMSALSAPVRPCGVPSPRGEGCDTGLPSTKKSGEAALVNLSAPQVPSSRAQPRDLYCTAAICTHAPSLKRHLGASFFAFPSLTIYRSARKIPPLRPSLHARKTDRLIFGLGQTRKSLCGTSVSM